MPAPKPYCLSIAGFDPCGGAGILADIKTFEQLGVYGLSVCSSITYQNDSEFNGIKWLNIEAITAQLLPLKKYPVKAVKIGLIENLDVLKKIIQQINHLFGTPPIVWDPILKASAGFNFHSETELPETLLEQITLITPNKPEYDQLNLSKVTTTNILLKGGHREKKGTDTLFTNEGSFDIDGKPFNSATGKHGTGCVLSASITSNLAKGYKISEACKSGKEYVEKFILSNESNLGYHT